MPENTRPATYIFPSKKAATDTLIALQNCLAVNIGIKDVTQANASDGTSFTISKDNGTIAKAQIIGSEGDRLVFEYNPEKVPPVVRNLVGVYAGQRGGRLGSGITATHL